MDDVLDDAAPAFHGQLVCLRRSAGPKRNRGMQSIEESEHVSDTNTAAASPAISHNRFGDANVLRAETGSGTDKSTTAAVASISDQDWYVSRTHGVYHIPACPKDQPYALVLLTSRGDVIDLGDNRRFPFLINGTRNRGRLAAGPARSRDLRMFRAEAIRGRTRSSYSTTRCLLPPACSEKAIPCGRAAIRTAKYRTCTGERRLRWASSASGHMYR